MTIERLLLLLQGKEDQHLEFKEASFALPASLFETICAMLNGEGGDILLGVNDFGTITGIEAEQVDKMIKDLVSLSNNPTKITPTFILYPRKHQIDGKWLIHIQIPASSQVHKASKIIYDRSSDGDFKITEAQQIAEFSTGKEPITPRIQFIQRFDLKTLMRRFFQKSEILFVATMQITHGLP